MTVFDLGNGFHYAMHGAGAYKGLRQTNTLEAFQHWYQRGVRVFEFDLAVTEDGQYVAVAHTVDKKSLYRMEITEEPAAYTYAWFMQQRLFPLTTKGLTPLSLQGLVSLLMRYSDCIFMLDLFGMFSPDDIELFLTALDACADVENTQDRLLLEAYNTAMSDAMCAHTPRYHIIYCVRYEGNIDADGVGPQFLIGRGIRFISYPWMYAKECAKELREYIDAGLIAFSRTTYNTNHRKLRSERIAVNIVGYRFDGMCIVFQSLQYIWACRKRVFVKIKMRWEQH